MKTAIKGPPKSTLYSSISSSLVYGQTSHPAPAVPHRLALINSQGTIVAVNKEWIALAQETGASLDRIGPGANYFEVCRKAATSGGDSDRALAGIHAVLTQRAPSFAMNYACTTSSGPSTFHMAVSPITYEDARVAIAHTEIGDVRRLNDKNFRLLQQFARRSINAQEEERRRKIGRAHV